MKLYISRRRSPEVKPTREGKPTPAGAVLSKDGVEMTDSKAILQAFVDDFHSANKQCSGAILPCVCVVVGTVRLSF